METNIHKVGKERLLEDQRKEQSLKKEKQPVPVTGKQATLDGLTQASSAKREAQDDLILMFLAAGIPVEKVDHPVFRKWLAKTTQIHGCIPRLSSDFPRQSIQRLYDDTLESLRAILCESTLAILFDEWTDDAGIATIAVIAITSKAQVAIDVIFLEGCGKSAGIEHKEVAAQLVNTMGRLAIDTIKIGWIICDDGSVMLAAYNNMLSVLWPKSQLLLCMAHKLNHVGRALQREEDFVVLNDVLFAGAHLLSVPKNAARKRRWLKLLDQKGLPHSMPPKVGDTRWNAWADAAQWWCSHIILWKEFIESEYQRVPHVEGNPKTLLERHHELLAKWLFTTTIKVSFVADHTGPLMSAINEAQRDGVVGPLLFDILMNVVVYYEELGKTQKYSPRTEELLQKLKAPQKIRDTLHNATQTLLDALRKALSERQFTLDLLKELRVLHPNNLNMVSHSQSDYPILFADHADISFEWATYC